MAWREVAWFLAGVATMLLVVAWSARRRRRVIEDLERALVAIEKGGTVPGFRSQTGGPLGRFARRFRDLIPRLEVQMAAREREHEQLRAVLSGMAEGVLAVDSRGRLLFANPTATRLFGLGGDSLGRLVAELVRSIPIQESIASVLATRKPYSGEVVLPAREAAGGPNSQVRVLAVHGTPLAATASPGAVLVFHDVTELRRLERMRQDFVANASHELKTPLASIRAYTESLLDWALAEPDVNIRFLQQIDEQAERLNLLILDLLSLARLESGQDAFDHRPVALAPIVRAIAEGHKERALAKGLAFRIDVKRSADLGMVRADEEAIRQILDNLIDNAIKYTPEGGKVEVIGRIDAGEAVLTVIDSGVGIPPEDLPRIFERFYRVDKARSREVGGTGLGLSIVKHLAQSLGGQVAVQSRPGSGSAFTVRLPRLDNTPSDASPV